MSRSLFLQLDKAVHIEYWKMYGKYEIFKTKNMGEEWEFYGIHGEKCGRNCSEFKLKVQTWQDETQKQLIVHRKSWFFYGLAEYKC